MANSNLEFYTIIEKKIERNKNNKVEDIKILLGYKIGDILIFFSKKII